jgi:tetratricopeptide (TPR) repeat protein
MKLKYIILLLTCPAVVFAQSKKQAGNIDSGAAKGKPMSSMDSVIVKQLYFSALREKTIENFTLAAELFNLVLQSDPNNDAALYELSGLKKAQNNFADAQQLLEKAVTINADNEWYWVALADCYQKTNDVAKLENVFNQLIRINSEKPEYYFDKANAYFIGKKYEDALSVYKQLEQLTGLNEDIVANRQKVYLRMGKVDLAASEMEQMIDADPGQIRYYLLLSEIYNSNNFNDKALKVLERAERINPDYGPVHLAMADIYRNKKNYEASFAQLKQAFAIPDLEIEQKIRIVLGYLPKFPDPNAKASALELSRIITVAHPADARAYALYGDMLVQNDKVKEAKPLYKKAIELNEQIYSAHEQLVRIELSTNDMDGTIKDGENALALFPNQAWMNYMVGAAWLQKKNYNKAVSYLKNATSLELQDKELLSQCYSSLGDCYHALNDYKRSDEAYDKSLSYNPDNAYTLNNYAYYLSLREEGLEKAAAMSKHSNDLQPANASFEDTYAWILFKQKKYAEAKVWIEKALIHDKDRSAVQTEHYGDIMFYLGNVDAAVQSWKKAKEYGAQSPALDRKINEKKYIQ